MSLPTDWLAETLKHIVFFQKRLMDGDVLPMELQLIKAVNGLKANVVNKQRDRLLQLLALLPSVKVVGERIRGPLAIPLSLELFRALRVLILDGVDVKTVRGLSHFRPQLRVLGCHNIPVRVQNLVQLCGGDNVDLALPWPNLEVLELRDNFLDDFDEALKYVPTLIVLDGSHNYIRDISRGLLLLPNLQTLILHHNCVQSLEGLSHPSLSALSHVNVSHNLLSSLEGLQALKFLVHLDISNNNIKDVTTFFFLSSIRSLRQLFVSSNPFCDESDYRFHIFSELAGCWRHVALDGVAIKQQEESRLIAAALENEREWSLRLATPHNTPSRRTTPNRSQITPMGNNNTMDRSNILTMNQLTRSMLDESRAEEDDDDNNDNNILNTMSLSTPSSPRTNKKQREVATILDSNKIIRDTKPLTDISSHPILAQQQRDVAKFHEVLRIGDGNILLLSEWAKLPSDHNYQNTAARDNDATVGRNSVDVAVFTSTPVSTPPRTPSRSSQQSPSQSPAQTPPRKRTIKNSKGNNETMKATSPKTTKINRRHVSSTSQTQSLSVSVDNNTDLGQNPATQCDYKQSTSEIPTHSSPPSSQCDCIEEVNILAKQRNEGYVDHNRHQTQPVIGSELNITRIINDDVVDDNYSNDKNSVSTLTSANIDILIDEKNDNHKRQSKQDTSTLLNDDCLHFVVNVGDVVGDFVGDAVDVVANQSNGTLNNTTSSIPRILKVIPNLLLSVLDNRTDVVEVLPLEDLMAIKIVNENIINIVFVSSQGDKRTISINFNDPSDISAFIHSLSGKISQNRLEKQARLEKDITKCLTCARHWKSTMDTQFFSYYSVETSSWVLKCPNCKTENNFVRVKARDHSLDQNWLPRDQEIEKEGKLSIQSKRTNSKTSVLSGLSLDVNTQTIGNDDEGEADVIVDNVNGGDGGRQQTLPFSMQSFHAVDHDATLLMFLNLEFVDSRQETVIIAIVAMLQHAEKGWINSVIVLTSNRVLFLEKTVLTLPYKLIQQINRKDITGICVGIYKQTFIIQSNIASFIILTGDDDATLAFVRESALSNSSSSAVLSLDVEVFESVLQSELVNTQRPCDLNISFPISYFATHETWPLQLCPESSFGFDCVFALQSAAGFERENLVYVGIAHDHVFLYSVSKAGKGKELSSCIRRCSVESIECLEYETSSCFEIRIIQWSEDAYFQQPWDLCFVTPSAIVRFHKALNSRWAPIFKGSLKFRRRE